MGLLGFKSADARAKKGNRTPASREINGGAFVGQNLSGHDLANRTVRDSNFDHSILSGADLERSTFIRCTFNATTLTRAKLRRATFENCQFNRAMLNNADAQQTQFATSSTISYDSVADGQPEFDSSGTTFAHAVLSGSNFTGAALAHAILHDVEAQQVNFRDANLEGASFDRCSIGGSFFTGARLDGADFSLCENARKILPATALPVVEFYKRMDQDALNSRIAAHERWLLSNGREGERLVLRVIDLTRNKVDGRDLSGADLRTCKLDRVCYRNSRFVHADLRGSSLDGTIFRACDLRGARLDAKSIVKVRLQDSRL
ncbi:MAG: pentapeptide repeat-containing protein [Alphaproteobacteria bacterium]|nr:pentapeptide repeat-containing protein [Alphaproteobacteria bacterium]